MADEHFFHGPGDFSYSGGIGAVPFFGSSYAPPTMPPPPGLDVAAAFRTMLPAWADLQLPADSCATTAHIDSALSSLVSSPAHNGGGGGGDDDDVAIGDLIGRLGSICSAASANNSCYSTPLSSPPHGGAPPPHAAALWGGGYHGGPETGGGRLSRVASSKSLGGPAAGATTTPASESSELETSPIPATMGGKPETAEPAPVKGAAARKRKASGKKGKGAPSATAAAAAATNGTPKRTKVSTDGDNKGNDEDTDDSAAAAAAAEEEKPAKDYIHVRARRGQATDSHSLAERVRRERISERMKMLQSLVPGCNKITGKALMLDEIINYVQSLQRQVEFLSMKLATMNPELELDAQPQYPPAMQRLAAAYPAFSPFAATVPDATIHHPGGAAGFSCWDQPQQQDLQSVVQQQQGNSVGMAIANHMKAELP